MANAAAVIYESIWRDPQFRQLSRGAQALYVQLLSQKELDCAGVLPLQPEKWATGCNGLTVQQVWDDLNELQDSRFVFYDLETYEAFIRTHVRNSNVMKVPNMRKSARRAAGLIGSSRLRSLLALELKATGDPEMVAKADEINPSATLTEGFANHSVTLPGKPRSEPNANPSETLPEGSGVGMGMGVTHLGNNSRGVNRPICAKHPNGNPQDENCRGCMKVREWDQDRAAQAEHDELEAKRLARQIAESCPTCQGTNWVPDTEPAVRCEHLEVALNA